MGCFEKYKFLFYFPKQASLKLIDDFTEGIEISPDKKIPKLLAIFELENILLQKQMLKKQTHTLTVFL